MNKSDIARQYRLAQGAHYRVIAARARLKSSVRRTAVSPGGLAAGVAAGVGIGSVLSCKRHHGGNFIKNSLNVARLAMPLVWLWR